MSRIVFWISCALFSAVAHQVAPDLRSYLVLGACALAMLVSARFVDLLPREEARDGQ